jgi:hypothetical protein
MTPLARLFSGKSAQYLRNPLLRTLFKRAQAKAQRTALAQRKGVLSTDDWLDESLGFAGSE